MLFQVWSCYSLIHHGWLLCSPCSWHQGYSACFCTSMVTCEHIDLCVTSQSCFATTFVSPGSIRLWLTQSRLHCIWPTDTLDEFCVHVWNVLSATLQTARWTLCCSSFPRHAATSASGNLSHFSLNQSVLLLHLTDFLIDFLLTVTSFCLENWKNIWINKEPAIKERNSNMCPLFNNLIITLLLCWHIFARQSRNEQTHWCNVKIKSHSFPL